MVDGKSVYSRRERERGREGGREGREGGKERERECVCVCVWVCVITAAGYIVSSGLRRSNGVQGLRMVVQSEKGVQLVERRMEAFLQGMEVNSHMKEWYS